MDDDDEFRFNVASTHEGHLRQNGILTWFGIDMAVMTRRPTSVKTFHLFTSNIRLPCFIPNFLVCVFHPGNICIFLCK